MTNRKTKALDLFRIAALAKVKAVGLKLVAIVERAGGDVEEARDEIARMVSELRKEIESDEN